MAITGSQPAYAQCRAGIERAGASRAGAFVYVPTIGIGNADGSGMVDGTALTIRASLRITQAINDTPASAYFTLKPNLTGPRPPIKVGQLVTIAGEFGGQILRLTRRYEHGVGEHGTGQPIPFVDVECIDYSRLLNRRLVTAHYAGQSASTIAALILQAYTSGFSGAGIAPNLPTIDDFPVTNETVTGALMRLAKLVDGEFFVDADRVVHLFGQAGDTSPKAGTPPVPLTMPMDSLRAFQSLDDGSQLRTRMVMEGQATATAIATPGGATTISIDASGPVDYLLVGGGAGGGTGAAGGGGGGGAVVPGTDTVKSGAYPIVVGGGGNPNQAGGGSTFNGHAPGYATPGAPVAGGNGGGGTSGNGYGGGNAAPATLSVQAIVVAGGGGGGAGVAQFGGGGGGGGVIPIAPFNLGAGAYTVTVGGGGTGGDTPTNGANSAAFGYTAIGGGAGGISSATIALKLGKAGGCGGGSASSDQPNNPGGAGTAGQGYNGGAGDQVGASAAGGGGGAGQAGVNASGPVGGTGGNGITWGPGQYGGGGGGNGQFGYGNGGAGGGGRGGGGGNPGVAGAPNSGGGGGGGGYNGGSGVVVVLLPLGAAVSVTGGGVIQAWAGYTLVTFTSSGTLTIPNPQAGGGGGGASAAGFDAAPGLGGQGRDGVASALSGASVTYGGGGGGNGATPGGGGAGGGGLGNGSNGAPNSGGGGGGNGGTGGSGVVILSYPSGSLSATGGTISQVGGRTIHTFTANGTWTVSQIVLTAPPPIVTDLPIDDASQLNPAGGRVRIGFSTYPYTSTGGAPVTPSNSNPPGTTLSAAAAALATSLAVVDSSVFTAPGWVRVGDQIVRFGAKAAGTLTGIPSLGFGALNAPAAIGTQVSWLPQINLSPGGVTIAPPVNVGDPIVQVVVVDDAAAQAAAAAVEGGDGVHEQGVQDGRLGVAGMTARANAELIDFDHDLLSATWATDDRNAKAGRMQAITVDGAAVSLMITSVDVTFELPHHNPRRTCTGSTVRAAALLDAIVTGTN